MAAGLKRRIGLGLLTAYGVGVMVGAGIYVLVGVVAGEAGVWAPVSFLFAALVALPTALAYAELGARVPEAAGDSSFIEFGLNRHDLAVAAGLVNIVAGTLSAAAVLRGGVGYLTALLPVPFMAAVIGLGLLLTLIAVAGILESLAFAGLMTLLEVAGLGLVIWAGFSAVPAPDWTAPPPPAWGGILAASVLAFFAFIGFGDIVKLAEEVIEPARTIPRAIVLALGITAVLYVLVSLAALRAVPAGALADSGRPLTLVWQTATGGSAAVLAAIGVAAAANGILGQIVMVARVIFGLGKRSPSLRLFRHAHPRFGTPVLATLLVGGVVIVAALLLPVAALAELTTLALLVVFALVNAALIGLKRKAPRGPFTVPVWVPWAGLAGCLATFAAAFGGGS